MYLVNKNEEPGKESKNASEPDAQDYFLPVFQVYLLGEEKSIPIAYLYLFNVQSFLNTRQLIGIGTF